MVDMPQDPRAFLSRAGVHLWSLIHHDGLVESLARALHEKQLEPHEATLLARRYETLKVGARTEREETQWIKMLDAVINHGVHTVPARRDTLDGLLYIMNAFADPQSLRRAYMESLRGRAKLGAKLKGFAERRERGAIPYYPVCSDGNEHDAVLPTHATFSPHKKGLALTVSPGATVGISLDGPSKSFILCAGQYSGRVERGPAGIVVHGDHKVIVPVGSTISVGGNVFEVSRVGKHDVHLRGVGGPSSDVYFDFAKAREVPIGRDVHEGIRLHTWEARSGRRSE